MRLMVLAALAIATPGVAQQQQRPPQQVITLPAASRPSGAPAPATVAGPAAPDAPRAAPQGAAAVSRNAPVNGVLVLYGNERCPTDRSGNEIVVCSRRSAAEQFRVPKELREFQVTPENASWAAKAQETIDTGVGVNGTGSCSVVGPGGQSGCFAQQARATKAENNQRKLEQSRVP